MKSVAPWPFRQVGNKAPHSACLLSPVCSSDLWWVRLHEFNRILHKRCSFSGHETIGKQVCGGAAGLWAIKLLQILSYASGSQPSSARSWAPSKEDTSQTSLADTLLTQHITANTIFLCLATASR